MDTRSYSVGYVASWSAGDGKTVFALAEEILGRSQRIVVPLQERLQALDRTRESERIHTSAMER